jgi:hypothetical protein
MNIGISRDMRKGEGREVVILAGLAVTNLSLEIRKNKAFR